LKKGLRENEKEQAKIARIRSLRGKNSGPTCV
jgi:hypothetical protein